MDILLQERHERQLRKANKAKKKEEAKSSLKDDKAKGVGGGSDPLEPPSPSSSSSSSSPYSPHSTSSNPFKSGYKPKIKLDVKFDLPKYCGELQNRTLFALSIFFSLSILCISPQAFEFVMLNFIYVKCIKTFANLILFKHSLLQLI